MLRLCGGQVECLWDEVLPVEVRESPDDLARLDRVWSDRVLLFPIADEWQESDRERGRLSVAMEMFVRGAGPRPVAVDRQDSPRDLQDACSPDRRGQGAGDGTQRGSRRLIARSAIKAQRAGHCGTALSPWAGRPGQAPGRVARLGQLTRIRDEISPVHAPSPPSDDAPRTARLGSQNGRAPIGQSASAYRVVVLAYIIAVSMPPIGFILGLILAIRFDKPASKQGAWVIAVSVVAAVVWAVIIAGGALNTTSSDF
jgi:hypothetical protein